MQLNMNLIYYTLKLIIFKQQHIPAYPQLFVLGFFLKKNSMLYSYLIIKKKCLHLWDLQSDATGDSIQKCKINVSKMLHIFNPFIWNICYKNLCVSYYWNNKVLESAQ